MNEKESAWKSPGGDCETPDGKWLAYKIFSLRESIKMNILPAKSVTCVASIGVNHFRGKLVTRWSVLSASIQICHLWTCFPYFIVDAGDGWWIIYFHWPPARDGKVAKTRRVHRYEIDKPTEIWRYRLRAMFSTADIFTTWPHLSRSITLTYNGMDPSFKYRGKWAAIVNHQRENKGKVWPRPQWSLN